MSSGVASSVRSGAEPRRLRHYQPRPWWGVAALGVLIVVGGAFLAYETRGTTFFQDEWAFILYRRGTGIQTFLEPHNQHLSLVPAVMYKLLFATVGMPHYWPYRACVIGAHLICVALVFFYARRRVGDWLALVAAAVIMFFGPGWQDILWPFQMAWVIAVAAGIGALIALDRDTRQRNVSACILLALALASAGPGLAVAVGLVVEVARRRPWRELWIVGIPIALYVAWWLGYQRSSLIARSLLLVPHFVFDSAAGVVSSLTGLAQVNVTTDTGTYLQTGPALLAIGLVAASTVLVRQGRVPARVVTLAVIPLSFWIIAGVGRAEARVGAVTLTFSGDEGRYLYVGAVWVVLLAVELARGVRPGKRTLALAGVLAAAAIASNISTLQSGAGLLRGQAQVTRAEIGTLDMTRRIVPANFASNGFVFFAYLTARAYFAAEHDLGTSAPTPAQIAGFAEAARVAADAQLIRIHHPTLVPVSLTSRAATASATILGVDSPPAGTYTTNSGCVDWRPGSIAGGAPLDLTLPAPGLVVRAGSAPATVSLRRFSDAFQAVGVIAAGATAALKIRPDLARQAWHVQIASTRRIVACVL